MHPVLHTVVRFRSVDPATPARPPKTLGAPGWPTNSTTRKTLLALEAWAKVEGARDVVLQPLL